MTLSIIVHERVRKDVTVYEHTIINSKESKVQRCDGVLEIGTGGSVSLISIVESGNYFRFPPGHRVKTESRIKSNVYPELTVTLSLPGTFNHPRLHTMPSRTLHLKLYELSRSRHYATHTGHPHAATAHTCHSRHTPPCGHRDATASTGLVRVGRRFTALEVPSHS